MKFAEQFPSLKGFNFLIDGRIHTNYVQEYCLDKQKVKTAMENVALWYQEKEEEITPMGLLLKLKEELGLVDK